MLNEYWRAGNNDGEMNKKIRLIRKIQADSRVGRQRAI